MKLINHRKRKKEMKLINPGKKKGKKKKRKKCILKNENFHTQRALPGVQTQLEMETSLTKLTILHKGKKGAANPFL